MLKRIFIALMLLTTGFAVAQQGTTSPYSFFGIGTLKFKGTVENRSMGGIGVYSDSIHLNLQNPASVAGLQLVNYSLAGSHKYTGLATDAESQQITTTSFDYLAIGIPMGKFGASFGLLPYTSSGYKLENVDGDNTTQFEGFGGLNRAFLTLGYQVTPELSVGVEANYNFGNIENRATTFQEDVQLGIREINRSNIRGFDFNFGAMYKRMVTKELEIQTSVAYAVENEFTSENQRILATILELPNGGVSPVDFREIDVEDTAFSFPSQFTLGAGIGKPKKWFLGAEYTSQKTSNFANLAGTPDNVIYDDASKVRVGGFFIPNYNAFGSYFKRMVYRGGFRMEQTGVNINGESIDEFGISFGVGLPVGKVFSNLNLGFELGRRGTKSAGLVEETFFNTFISLSLNDRWFEKRYYD